MKIRIESPQVPLAASLNRYLRRRIEEDLAFCAGRIREVRAYLAKARTPYAGIDKQCRIVVRLGPEGEVVARSADADLYMAIRRAADRLQRSVARHATGRAEAAGGAARVPLAAGAS